MTSNNKKIFWIVCLKYKLFHLINLIKLAFYIIEHLQSVRHVSKICTE